MKRTKKRKISKYKVNKNPQNYTKEELEMILTQGQRCFCREYVGSGWNKTQSYKRAFGTNNTNAASANAAKLLQRPTILQYIEYLKENYEELAEISIAKNLKEYARIAYSSIADMHQDWMSLKKFSQLTPAQKKAIESIETRTITTKGGGTIEQVKIKLYNKLDALKRIDALLGYDAPKKVDKTVNKTSVNITGATIEDIRKAYRLDELEKPE